MGHESRVRIDRPDSVNDLPQEVLHNIEFTVARLELEHGDILVVKGPVPKRAPDLSYFMPAGVRVLYIPPEVELSVLTKAEVEHLLNPQPAVTESGGKEQPNSRDPA